MAKSFVRSSKFRHVFGKETKQDDCFNGVNCDTTGDNGVAVNGKYLAVISSSKVYVLSCDKPARYDTETKFIDTKTNGKVLDVAWNPFNDDQLACCSDDTHIKLYDIPEGGIAYRDDAYTEVKVDLSYPIQKKITNIYWHPTVENILASISHCPHIIIWNLTYGEPVVVIDDSVLEGVPFGLAWNYDGSLIASVSKDKALRIIDPRTGTVLKENDNCHEGTRGSKVTFTKDGRLITFGSEKNATRQIRLWDPENLCKPVHELPLDSSPGTLNPFIDYELDIFCVFAKGDARISFYEIGEDEVYYLNAYSGTTSMKGGNFIPKRACNVSIQEIARFYKVHPQKERVTKIEPISIIVPRKNAKNFQSDIYPPCQSGIPCQDSEEWLGGGNKSPILHDFSQGEQQQQQHVRKPVMQTKRTPAQTPISSSGKSQGYGGQQSATNGIPEGVDLLELVDDMKKVKATVRKLTKRVKALEEQLDSVADIAQDEEEEEEE